MCVFLCVEFASCFIYLVSCITKKYGERGCILCRQGRWLVACITAGCSPIELQTPLVWEVKYSDSSATCYQQSGKYDQFLVLRGRGGQVCWIQTHE